MNLPQPQEPRLPQIDPVTFAALNALDNFIARAPLTRQEHAEANRSLHHLVQTIEMLQGTLRQLSAQTPPIPFFPPAESNGHSTQSDRANFTTS